MIGMGRISRVASVLAAAFAVAACSSSSGGGGGDSTFSCYAANGSSVSCYEYKNVSSSELSTLMSSCSATKGTGCPTANLVGCCTTSQTSMGLVTETCYYPPITAASAMKGCMQSGTWSTSP